MKTTHDLRKKRNQTRGAIKRNCNKKFFKQQREKQIQEAR